MWHPPDMALWSGRVDTADGETALRWHQRVRGWGGLESLHGEFALHGFGCDEGVRRNHGRTGAVDGPRALRRTLANLAVPASWSLRDAGDVLCEGGRLEEAQDAFGERTRALLDAGAFVLSLGGGHEIAWASFQGLAAHLEAATLRPRIGVLNIDAHFDLRSMVNGATSGTPFRQIADWCAEAGCVLDYAVLGISPVANTAALFERARAMGAVWIEDVEFHRLAQRELEYFLERFLDGLDVLQLSVCLDAFPAAFAPGVSAPAPLGIDVARLVALLRHCGAACRRRGVRWLLGEVAELNPLFDIDGRTARLGARIVHEMIAAQSGRGA